MRAAQAGGAEGLEDGFLGGESRREVLGGIALRLAVGDLLRGEDRVPETLLALVQIVFYARNREEVNADADNHCWDPSL